MAGDLGRQPVLHFLVWAVIKYLPMYNCLEPFVPLRVVHFTIGLSTKERGTSVFVLKLCTADGQGNSGSNQ